MSKLKKIAVFDFFPLDWQGGVSKFCRNLTTALSSEDYNFEHVSFYKGNSNESKRGLIKVSFFIKALNYCTRYRFVSLYFLYYIHCIKPDICIINYGCFLRYIKFFPKKCKLIYVQHTKVTTLLSNHANFGTYKNFLHITKYLDSFICLDEFDMNLISYLSSNSRMMVKTIHHSHGLEVFNGKKTANKNLIMLARLDNSVKRFDLAISAMDLLPDFTLNIYGDGSDKSYVKNLIGSKRNIVLHDFSDNVTSILDVNSIHIMLSEFEGFGITNIEAMARGLPVIIRDTFPAAKSLATGSGILLNSDTNPKDIANSVLSIYDSYTDFSEEAVIKSCFYSPKVFMRQWLAFLQDISGN
jgi:glycosyltransferase involved in cell wall biosynthesis